MILYDSNKLSRLRHRFPLSETIKKNYSQAYQDMFVLSMLNGKKNGTYLEIGAMDAIFVNNTYLLESQFDWKGLSIDISPSSKTSFVNRINPIIIEDALKLNYENILQENNFGHQIDYLSLDIEPMTQTLECLKCLPLDKYRFSVITYETDFYDQSVSRETAFAVRNESREIFKSHGYQLVVGNIANTSTEDIFEDWYVDPKVISSELLNIFQDTSEFNNTSEKYMLV